ncbi:MAG: NAD-glutamate dehydrogenase [Deferrisomatales bacterium]
METGVDTRLYGEIRQALTSHADRAVEHLDWLTGSMHPYFFITMKEEVGALVQLCNQLDHIPRSRKVTLVDQDKRLIVARRNLPGSLYDTLKTLQEREISYAELTQSLTPLPNGEEELEIQKFEFDRKEPGEIAAAGEVKAPAKVAKPISAAMKRLYPGFDFSELDKVLGLLWINNEAYVSLSPPERVARILWAYQQARRHDGLYLDVEETQDVGKYKESRLVFAVGNPPQKGFLTQAMEVFQRFNVGVRRSYSLNINTGVHPYFLGTFYVITLDGRTIERGNPLFRQLQMELYNTQILSTSEPVYTDFVARRVMSGEEASLTNAIIAFCHTNLSHNQPDRFDLETVKQAFQLNPEMTLQLVRLFRTRFDPELPDRERAYEAQFEETARAVESYNTGHKYLDEIRRTIFRTALVFIRHTLKTNFFVPEKHALAFRLDPAYLDALGPEFTSDLPPGQPFRITFFFGRYGAGYHIGFSDIARGGWRTIICRDHDEFVTNANTLFREVYVLAHTQHLKNKDIYEGGSKMTVVLNTEELEASEDVTPHLYKLQYGFINAFFDIFVTGGGKAKHPRVVDYYGQDEPIELGPDENMHDAMIELIARQSVKRGYLLGIGIMSSKRVGINHKEYGVTSQGLIKFTEIAMEELGLDMGRDPFTVKITGGTNGDVAGNALRLLLERAPQVNLVSIVAGAGALYDPQGADREELGRLVLQKDVVDFDPERLHPGGFLLFRRQRKQDGLRELYRKLLRTEGGVEETWVTADELNRESDRLIFSVPADVFLPCGGRPETIDEGNWGRLFLEDGSPTARIIAEGANSYITPRAREEIQKKGVILLRDASANKCGVISSSYEIIANLLMSEEEFLEHKEEYVRDVLAILDRRAEEEARLIFKRHKEAEGKIPYTEISRAISEEINEHYAELFAFFQKRPELCEEALFKRVVLNHMPAFIRENKGFRTRIQDLPPKYTYAILASEVASFIVYQGGWEIDLESTLKGYLNRYFW